MEAKIGLIAAARQVVTTYGLTNSFCNSFDTITFDVTLNVSHFLMRTWRIYVNFLNCYKEILIRDDMKEIMFRQ